MRRRPSIRIQLLALALAAILPVAGAVAYVIVDAFRASRNQAENEIRNLAATTTNDLAATIAESERLLSLLARRPLVRALDPRRCDPIIAEFVKLHPDFANLGARTVRGESVCSFLPKVAPANVAVHFPWFQEGIASRRFIVGDAFRGSGSGRWVSVLTYPLLDDRGAVIGVLGLPLDLLKLQSRIFPPVAGNTLVSVIDRQGSFLMRSGDAGQWIGKSVGNPGNLRETRRHSGETFRVPGVDGITRIFAFQTDARSGWLVSVGIPEDALFAPVQRRLAAAVVIVLGTLLVALALVRRIGAAIEKPIRDLEATTEKVASGDIAARASLEGPAELANVAREFNRMLEVRERAETELRDLYRTLIVLTSCNEAQVHATGEQELLDEMCRILVERGGHALVWIGFAERDPAKRVRPAAKFGATAYLDSLEVSWADDELGRGPTGTAIRSGQPVHIRDTLIDGSFLPWRAKAERFGFRSTIALPLGRDLPAFGALSIYSTAPNRFNEKEVRLLVDLANDLTYRIQSLRTDARRRQVEEDVRLQDKRFRALVENGADGIALFGGDGTILYMGPSTVQILGYRADEMEGRSAFEFIHPDDVAEVAKYIEQSVASPGKVVTARARVRHKNGAWRQMEGAFNNLLGEPSVKAIVNNFRDITERLESDRAQRESDERFRQIAENIREVFWMTDPSKNSMLYVSPAYEDIWQRSVAGLYREPRTWMDAIHPEDRERVLKAATEKQVIGQYDEEYRILRPDGTVRWIRDRAFPIRDSHGAVYRVVGTAEDITEHRLAEVHINNLTRIHAVLSGINALIVRVRDREELFRGACRIAIEAGKFRMAWIGIVDRDAMVVKPVAWDGDVRGFLDSAPLAVTQTRPEGHGLAGRAVRTKNPVISNDAQNDPHIVTKKEFQERGIASVAVIPLLVEGEAVGALALYAADTGYFDDEEMKLLKELAGDISFAAGHIEKTERLDYVSYYDVLTGLANRTLFYDRLTQNLRSGEQGSAGLALVLLDIERFRSINDSLGRQAGDELLRMIAQRLARRVGDPGLVGRISADHFAFMLPGKRTADEIARIVEEQSRLCFGEPFRLSSETELRISVKAGIALHPEDGADAETLHRNAEAALKKAKASGERYMFYAGHMTERVAEKLTLENKLRLALERDEFVLHYQPKVDFKTRHIEGVEALIRWQSPELGLVPPMQFIPLMEETGMILEAGAWAMRRAVLDHREWVGRGISAPRVSVNVSAIQLRKRDFVQTVQAAMSGGTKSPGLDLEITESLVMEDIEENIKKLEVIRNMGIGIAVDDFGTGYSSLRYLAKLPVQTLKIDRSFIITMLEDANTMTLVSTIISMAHSLGLKVVAEGVDSEDQAKILLKLDCDQMQGYLFSRPVPQDKLLLLLHAEKLAAPRTRSRS